MILGSCLKLYRTHRTPGYDMTLNSVHSLETY